MAEFKLPLTLEGAVTAPTDSFVFTEPSAESVTYLDIGPVNVLEIQEFGWAVADGVNPLRLVVSSSVYDAGGIAPSTAPTLAVTGGTRATVVGTYHATLQPANGETLTVGLPAFQVTITFVTSLTPYDADFQVKIGTGTDTDTTFANLQALIERTGTHGVEYWSLYDSLGYEDSLGKIVGFEVSAIDSGADTITLRWREYGTEGNLCASTEAAANFSFASTTMTGGVDGTGTEPAAGTYRYFYTWYRRVDGAETGRSPIATVTKVTNANIAVTPPAASADTTFDYVRIYRTLKSGVDFHLVGTLPRALASPLTDAVSDETAARLLRWEEILHRDYVEGGIPRGLALAEFKGRLWTLGAKLHAPYTRGTVAVTKGSAAVTFSLKGVTANMANRTLKVDATSEAYRLISIAEGGPTGVLDRAYEGTTDGTAGFTIIDDYDAAKLRASAFEQFNLFAEDDSPGRVDTDDPAGGTALLATKSRLFAFSKTSIMSVSGDGQESWAVNRVSNDVGCAAQGVVLPVEGGGFFLSFDGFYAISPDESVLSISSPRTQRNAVAEGIDGTIKRINWNAIDLGYSEYDKNERVAIFGLPLDGASTPNYEIIFDLQSGTWTTYKRAEWTALTRIAMPNGDIEMLSGDRDGTLWHVDNGESDGFYGTEAVCTLTGAQTVRVLTVTGTPFTTTGDAEEGKPVIVLYADGKTVAYGKVASNTSDAVTLAEDLATAPAANDQIILGGIAWQAKSGFATGGEEYNSKKLRSVTIRHAPTTRGEYFLSFAVDDGDFQLCPVGESIGTLSQKDGKTRHMVQWPGDTHAINLRGFKPGGIARLRGGVFDFVIREDGRS